ncbi:uncharacterized protein [Rutidosis leptorrhynchoides]|uniref:uncharacterized protein n=1 Tax=Rutidosis leptorrhynchoides TaxID=125765 RepID=UPI003A996B48
MSGFIKSGSGYIISPDGLTVISIVTRVFGFNFFQDTIARVLVAKLLSVLGGGTGRRSGVFDPCHDECPKKKRPFRGLQPTETEQSCQWWIQSDVYFRGGKVPEDEIEVEVQDDEVDTDDSVVDGSEQTHHKHSTGDVHTEGLHDVHNLHRMLELLTKRVDKQEKELIDCKKLVMQHEELLSQQQQQYQDDDMCFNRSLSDNETERPSPMHIRRGIRERKPTGVLRSPFTTPGYRKPIEKLSKDVIEKVESMNAVKLGTEEDQGQQQINEDVVPMDTDTAAEVSVDKQPVKVSKRKRKEQDWATEEEIWGMIDRFINDQGTLQPPPPNAWRDGRKHAGPAKDPKTMIESKQETRCMFIFQNEQFIFINQDFWLRLLALGHSGYLDNLHIDGWATFLLRYRQRFLPRASQVYATPEFPAEVLKASSRWTIMPLGFLNMFERFKTYFDNTQKEVGTQEESTTDGEGIIGQNPPDYMYLIGLGDGSVDLYPSWADCDQVLIPLHFWKEEHFLLLQLKLEEMKVFVYDSLPGHVSEKKLDEVFKILGDNLPVYLKAIDYFNKTQDSQIVGYYENKESVELMIEPGPVVPMQTGGHGDCGVWVCIHMERIIYGREEVDNIGDAKKAAEQYRNRMARTFFRARFDTQEPPPPTPPVEIQVD